MIERIKGFFQILQKPKGGLVFANRFTVVVCLITVVFDQALLLFDILQDGQGINFYDDILKNIRGNYIVVLMILLIGAIVWSINCELNERLHTLVIFSIMFAVIQILFVCMGTRAFVANYILVFITVIYARPLLTFIIGAVVFLLSIFNYWTLYISSVDLEIIDDSLELYLQETKSIYWESVLFYLPVLVIVAMLISYCLRKLFKYITYYTNERSVVQANSEAASLIQQQILEQSHIDDSSQENVTVYPFLKTADYVAGDFYDYYNIDRYHICFLIADVSGKGIAAGLFMARAKEVLKVIVKDKLEASNVMTRANEMLYENNSECMFSTAWIGILDVRTGVVNYSNAGHTSPILISNNRVVELNEVSGPMLGLFPGKEYKSHTVQIGEGDKILLYTDGVTEQPISDEERFGENRLIDFIKNNLDKDNLCDAIYDKVNSYERKQFDDLTMLQVNLDKLKTSTSKIGKVIHRKCFLAASPQSIRTFRSMMMEELSDSKVERKDIDTFYVACEEMITNIIKYAYGSTDNNGAMVIDFSAEDDYLSIVLKDSGVPFNPFLYDNSVRANNEDDITEGGRGIKIFTEIMDEYSYERVDDTNIVTARKYV